MGGEFIKHNGFNGLVSHDKNARCPVPPQYTPLTVSLTGLVHWGGTGHRDTYHGGDLWERIYCGPLTAHAQPKVDLP